ncbi:hypothetical protein AJ80_06364 [Polytolypa hystricis UAMH7299]|uniref:C2H2-type domain-containing protein n=1 Tax=Polytolypa hystricis (strain UAMH7299) TaxID=1447883 RepID=A0A2B7XWJ3_POLH7|nr:hypothetical protein AJ80_06364 [Polytolypa hystricis UAMH7299]
MGTALEALGGHQSLTSRRSAANNLPNFELPHPQLSQLPSQKYPLPPHISALQPSAGNVRVGNLLTPPLNTSSESPISSVNSSAPSSAQILPPYSQSFWPSTNAYNFGSGMPQLSWSPPFVARGGFSPLHSTGRNNSNSPTTVEGMSSNYDMHHLPPFQTPLPTTSGGSGQSPTCQQPQQQQTMANVLMNSQANNTPVSPTPTHQNTSLDPYGQKVPSTPLYGASQQSAPSPQSNYQPYQTGPHVSGASRMSPISVPLGPDGQQPHLAQFSRPYPSYSLPAMSGPIMSNVHNPGSQMALLGSMQPNALHGYNSGHAANMHHMYNGHPHASAQMHGLMQPGAPNDRPFKCDQCPQSFNRNHDLKRHKRIHLAVKPFPCKHCDKSFSRKDALKRHILVKGCGKDPISDNNGAVNASAGSTGTSKSDNANNGSIDRSKSGSRNDSRNGHH